MLFAFLMSLSRDHGHDLGKGIKILKKQKTSFFFNLPWQTFIMAKLLEAKPYRIYFNTLLLFFHLYAALMFQFYIFAQLTLANKVPASRHHSQN